MIFTMTISPAPRLIFNESRSANCSFILSLFFGY
jgi:hypothetical protein